MGQLECKSLSSLSNISVRSDILTQSTVGCVPLHAMRVASPEDGDAYFQGQVIDHGQLDNRAGGGKTVSPT